MRHYHGPLKICRMLKNEMPHRAGEEILLTDAVAAKAEADGIVEILGRHGPQAEVNLVQKVREKLTLPAAKAIKGVT